MTDYTCPGLVMPQPADAPGEGYVACYRAGHECPPAVATTVEDDTSRTITVRCPCCGDFQGSMSVPLDWDMTPNERRIVAALDATEARRLARNPEAERVWFPSESAGQ